MRCEDLDELLSAAADDELSAQEAASLEGHLRSCRRCRSRAKLLGAMKRAVRRAPASGLPEDVKNALLAEARKADARFPDPAPALPAGPVWRRPASWGAAAMFAAGAVLAVWVWRGRAAVIPIDMMLAAHDEYALTMPLAQSAQVTPFTPRLTECLAEAGAGR